MRALYSQFFPVYEQNRIRISPYKDRIVDGKIEIKDHCTKIKVFDSGFLQ